MKVSIIIPCYNTGKYLNDCLFSAVNQRYTDIEVICVNDGSTDNSLDILRDFREKNYVNLIIIDQENQGACAARNNGLKQASGEYIQFLDSDDMILPNKILNQIEFLKKSTYPGILVGDYEVINLKGVKTYEKKFNANRDPWLNLLHAELGCTCSNLFKKDDLVEIGGWNLKQKSSQETDLMFRLLKSGASVDYDHSMETIIRKGRPDAITKGNLKENWKRYVGVRLKIVDHLKEKQIEVNWQEANQVLFDAIRVMYGFDKDYALELHKKHIPKSFKPEVSRTTGRSYKILYPFLGFKWTEKLKSLK